MRAHSWLTRHTGPIDILDSQATPQCTPSSATGSDTHKYQKLHQFINMYNGKKNSETIEDNSVNLATNSIENEQLSLYGRPTGLRRQPTKYPHGLGVTVQTLSDDQQSVPSSYSRASTLRSSLNAKQQTHPIQAHCQRKFKLSTLQSPENLAELQVRRYKYPLTGNYYLDTQETPPKTALLWLEYGKRFCRWRYLRWPLIFLASILLFFGLITYCIWLHDVSVTREQFLEQREQFLQTAETTEEIETVTSITVINRQGKQDNLAPPTTTVTNRITTAQDQPVQESTILRAISTRTRQGPLEQTLTTLDYPISKGSVVWDKSSKRKDTNWGADIETTTLATEEAALVPAHVLRFTSGHQNSFGVPIEEDERILKLINGLFPYSAPTAPTRSSLLTKVSPTIPPVQPWKPTVALDPTGSMANNQENGCHSTSLTMCRGVLDYDLTYNSVVQLNDMEMDEYKKLFASNCSARAEEFVCATLEPECRPSHIGVLPPCRRICKAILEACSVIIANSDTLSTTFDCNFYPDSNDVDKCEDPTRRRGYCYDNEFECYDRSCIPYTWQCDNLKDCAAGEDEEDCFICEHQDEFRCRSNEKCVTESMRCDLKYDCFDGSDEENCDEFGSGEDAAFDEAALNSFPRVFSYASFLSPNQTDDKLYTYITANEDEAGSMRIEVHNLTSEISNEEITNNVSVEGRKTLVNFRDSKEIMMTSDSENKFKYSAARANRSSNKYTTSTTPLRPSGSLQLNATTETPKTMLTNCAPHQLRCVSGKCITVAQLCDKKIDCPDGADEQGCVYKARTTTARNSGVVSTPSTTRSYEKRTIRTTIKRKVKT